MIASAEQQPRETVILLHGLGRSRQSMAKIAQVLGRNKMRVINLGYPSTRQSIASLVNRHLAPAVQRVVPSSDTIHFVSHSLGGILVRYFLRHHYLPRLGRVVMLSPPNQGSEVAEYLKHSPAFQKMLGPAGQELGLGPESIPIKLGRADFELGVICGNRSSDPWFAPLFSGPNDGKVSVERAKLPGMKDFRVVPHGHTFIMQQPEVIDQINNFLNVGLFLPDPPLAMAS